MHNMVFVGTAATITAKVPVMAIGLEIGISKLDPTARAHIGMIRKRGSCMIAEVSILIHH